MDQVTTTQLRAAMEAVADAIEEKKDWLCELDGEIGDADHGVTMSIGFRAVREGLAELDEAATPTDLFNQSAKRLLNAMGGSAGPLFATAFMRAGASVKGKDTLAAPEMTTIIAAMTEGIASRGKAEAGEKTMLDAWLPATAAAQQANDANESLAAILVAAATGAESGAQATIAMNATKGRASRLGDRTIGHMDPGAASAALILATLADHFN